MLHNVANRELLLMRSLYRTAAEMDPEGAVHLIGLADCECFLQGRHPALVFELMKCDCRQALRKYIQGHGLPLLLVCNLGRNIFSGLRALSRIGVIHCDVKPDNLLLSLDKACDSGIATDVHDQSVHTTCSQDATGPQKSSWANITARRSTSGVLVAHFSSWQQASYFLMELPTMRCSSR